MGNPRNRTRKVSRMFGREPLAKRQRVAGEDSASTPETDPTTRPNERSAENHHSTTPLISKTSASAGKLDGRLYKQEQKRESQGGFILLDLAKVQRQNGCFLMSRMQNFRFDIDGKFSEEAGP